ncbi:MAG: hypothetical protein AB7T48_14560, partial [Solirubrobacterales bacterium]
VWVRRLFGANVSVPILATPTSWEGAPLRGPVDAFALDVAGFGQTAVAFRQQPGAASRLTAPRLMLNQLPDVFSESAQKFAGALLADGGVRAALGPPGIGVDPRGRYLAAFADGSATLVGDGEEFEAGQPQRVDDGGSSIPGAPLADLAETGAGVVAWIEQRGAAGAVRVQERRADGVNEVTDLSAPRGGTVGGLVLGSSGLGDAVLAWSQGSGAGAQIAVAVVDAPPDPFLVLLPSGWQRKPRVRIAWDHSPNAIGGVRYAVSVDDEPVREGLHGLSVLLKGGDLENGRHRIQVYAVDDVGQETGSRVGHLLVDRRPPRVKLRQRGPRLAVVVSDGRKGEASTLRKGSVKVSFGGAGRAARAGAAASREPKRKKAPTVTRSYAYSAPGHYRVTVSARDKAGNRTAFSKIVRVR